MAERLNELLRQGVTRIATFVPWQVVESDISHRLMRFLQAATERKFSVSLILTPEVGVHAVNSGLPKDVLSKAEIQAKHCDQGAVSVNLAPNAFALPSLFNPEFTKRYYGFLSRMDGFLADLGKTQPGLLERVTVVLTGSYWKYYRPPVASARAPFGGVAGDYSGAAGLAYRQVLDQFFSQREFTEPNAQAAGRWKTHSREELNRRWFYQQSEDVFRNRTFQLVRRKAAGAAVKEIELYTPEADPSMTYSHFLQMVSGTHADFFRLSALVDEAASRTSMASMNRSAPFIHWTMMGGFRNFADSEKQFLILKTLLLLGGLGGGVLIDEREWFSLSPQFRARAEVFARLIAQGDLTVEPQAMYLSSHLWSSAGKIWEEMSRRLGAGAQLVSSLEAVSRDRTAKLTLVDPGYILTREAVLKLAAWAKEGRTVVLPRSPLFTEAARNELETLLVQTRHLEVNLGVPFRLHAWGSGKIVVYEVPESLPLTSQGLSFWQTFLTAVLSVADVQSECSLSDNRASVIAMRSRANGTALFVLNGTRSQIMADLTFPQAVTVGDFSQSARDQRDREDAARSHAVPSVRFSLEAPPFGILPLSIQKPASGPGRDLAVPPPAPHLSPTSPGIVWN
jgi:hypothetical protein